MERILMSELYAWKLEDKRKPLLLEGARQVGKTYLLKEFGKRYFKNVAYINFQNPGKEIVDLFSGAIDPKRIVTMLELFIGMTISPKDTLIIFDEIQEVPRALTSLKYFFENASDYFVVAAGSLLGIFLHKETSFPVGKVKTLKLEPMSFEEFLLANDKKKIIEFLKADIIRELATTSTSALYESSFKEVLSDLFKQYIVVGGMPEVVADWVENHNIERINEIQGEILKNYRSDFSKHTDNTTAVRIRQVFDNLPAQFAKKNNKFLYGTIRTGARAREYEIAIEWLIDAGIVRRVHQVSCGDKIPLKSYINQAIFKLYFIDVGLFRHLAEIPINVVIDREEIFKEFNGLIAEQYVLQQLAKYNLFYWTSGETSEVDFIMQYGSEIIPIEVKSGMNVKAKSLKLFRDKYKPKISVRFSLMNSKYNDGLLNISLEHSFLFETLLKHSSEKCVK
jgi:predicted AAA+ superfamily ATPase